MSCGAYIDVIEEAFDKHEFGIELVHRIATAIGPQEISEETLEGYRAIVVMVAALRLGHDVTTLRNFTGYTHKFVTLIKANLESAGIWRRGQSYHRWDEFFDIIADRIAAEIGETLDDLVARQQAASDNV